MKTLKIALVALSLISANLSSQAQTFFEETFTGKYTEQFVNGGQKYEVNILNGKKQGLEIFWYESGRIKIQTNYVDDKEDGVWNQWYENGQQRAQSNFVNGKKEGSEYTWDKGGRLKSELLYKDGQVLNASNN